MTQQNREIKFRCFSKELGMSLPFTIEWLAKCENGSDIKEFEVCMQYTGLLDKNGKEIYEGDIIEWKEDSDDFISGEFTLRKEVKFEKGSFYTHKEFSVNENYLPVIANWGEVIGNIYENSELIK